MTTPTTKPRKPTLSQRLTETESELAQLEVRYATLRDAVRHPAIVDLLRAMQQQERDRIYHKRQARPGFDAAVAAVDRLLRMTEGGGM